MNKCICGGLLHIDVGDSILSGTYRWYVSYHCDGCGKDTEMDGCGIDSIPNNIKSLIIRKEGGWGLKSLTGTVRIKYLMDKFLQCKRIDSFEDIFFFGTQNQVKWVKKKLIENGIDENDLILKKCNETV